MSGNMSVAKSADEIEDRVWDLAKKIDFCMFTTWDGESQRARPMSARVRREDYAIYFLVDVAGHKNEQVERYPKVLLTFTDSGGNKYVSISGEAALSNDRGKIRDLWTAFDRAWWDDENDPSIRLLTVRPKDAELWDSPNQLVSTVKMLVAAVTGAKPAFGENAKVDL